MIILIVFLVLLSAIFSATETGVMSLSRFRLRHLVRKGNKRAKRVLDLLARPDRLLGVILIGNTFANIFASALTAIIAAHFFGQVGVFMGTILLTLVVLIFGESTPKTLAVLYPEPVALGASGFLKILLTLLYPLVWLVNGIGNGLLRLFGVQFDVSRLETLSIDELKTLLDETKGLASLHYKKMLLHILDLEQVTVEEIMVPRNEIWAIDITQSWENILTQLFECPYSFAPLYKDDINHAQGILNLRRVFITLQKQKLDKEGLLALAEEIYFIPQGASANQQLLNFRDQRQTIGLVVDEYGDIQGLISLQNIIEEIVGEFTQDLEENHRVSPQKDGSFLVDASMDIRDLNEMNDWHLSTLGPRTLSGLIIEYLETIPKAGICSRISGYPIEIIRTGHNKIKLIKIWPQLYQAPSLREE
jgi:Mg2+/Co2+ transporter CorB